MSRGAATTHGDAGATKLVAHRCRREAQLGTDLAQGPALGVQVGCTLNVHGATVTSLSGSAFTEASAVSGCRGRCLELGSVAEPQPHQR